MDNPEPVNASSTQSVNSSVELKNLPANNSSSRVTVDQLLLAGAHFGHLTQRWNPKMKRYIFMARNGIYLIDLNKTQQLIDKSCRKIAEIVAEGDDVLFVGTKKQARDIVESEAKRAECPYVTYRWLGGMLTNFATIRRSVKTLETYERMAMDGTYEKLTKKEQQSIEKSKDKLLRVLGGIRDMRRLPAAVFIIDTNHEAIGLAEARKLNIPVFAIVDTNVDPDLVDYPIPANDDAFKSIGLITRTIADAVLEGKRKQKDVQATEEFHPAEDKPKSRSRRSRRRRSRRKPSAEVRGDAAGSEDQGKKPAKPEREVKPQKEKKDSGAAEGKKKKEEKEA